MNRKEARCWAKDHNMAVGLCPYDGDPFAIVQDWNTVEDPNFAAVIAALGIDDDNFGFSDEYAPCSNCDQIIRTKADYCGWRPDYWAPDGGYYCRKCTLDMLDDYVEWYQDEVRADNLHDFLFEPETVDFTPLLTGLQNGLHEGMADDPHAIARFLGAQGLQTVFIVYPSQFYVEFDVWVRLSPDSDGVLDIEALREVLTRGPTRWDHDTLQPEFRESPSPAQRVQEGLKHPTVVHVSKQDFIDGKALDIAEAQAPDADVRSIVVD